MGVYSLIPKQNKSIFSPIRWYLTFGPSIVFLFFLLSDKYGNKNDVVPFWATCSIFFPYFVQLVSNQLWCNPQFKQWDALYFCRKDPPRHSSNHFGVKVSPCWRFFSLLFFCYLACLLRSTFYYLVPYQFSVKPKTKEDMLSQKETVRGKRG